MSAKSVGIAGLLALAGLALIAVIASNPLSTLASTDDAPGTQKAQVQLSADVVTPSQIAQPDRMGQLQATDDDDEDSENSEPYIGVAVVDLDDGSVKVVRVQEDGPADGILMSGDVITAVDGTTIDGTSDLVDAITEAGSGTTITLTITRDGSSQTADVTVGERDAAESTTRVYRSSRKFLPSMFNSPRMGKGKFESLEDSGRRIVHSKFVIENVDGSFSTYRAVTGTVSSVDASAGTFTLDPKDGSDSIDYTIDDDTTVRMNRRGDLGALNTDDDTFVIDIDGEVKLVQQGEQPGKRGHLFRGGKMFRFNDGGRWQNRSGIADQKAMIQKAMEIITSQSNDRM